MKIKQIDRLGKPIESLINIVDLAGSERRESPYAAEDRARAEKSPAKDTKRGMSETKQRPAVSASLDIQTEAKFINTSLSTLGRIFSMLGNRKL
jgi:hypothetical protein